MSPNPAKVKDIAYLQLSVQRALLGMVTPRMIAVTAGYTPEGSILIDGYFDPPATQDDWLLLTEVGTEVSSDFPAPTIVEERALVGERQVLDFWAFVRAQA